MSEPLAYLDGQFVPASAARIAVTDGGFVQGTSVAEQLRTFAGRIFRLDEHLMRLFHSLQIVGVDPGLERAALADVAQRLVAQNHSQLAAGDDLGLTIVVTPGPYLPPLAGGAASATVCLHTLPLRFDLWAAKYRAGEALSTVDVAQVPAACWPSDLKCRSRMHYYLADRQAAATHHGSRAVMLDAEGYVTETTTSNLVVYRREQGLLTPPRHKVLPGISLAVLAELAEGLAIPLVEHDLRPADLLAADEVLLTSTSPCIQPVTAFNGQPIGDGQPGAMFRNLISAWSTQVGVDIIGQAEQFAGR